MPEPSATEAFEPDPTQTLAAPEPSQTRPPGSPPDPPTLTAVGTEPPEDDRRRLDIPGYEIVRELGRGGMGVVYLARQTGLGREVALKVVLGGGHASASAVARFLAEAKAAAAVRHPGIAQVYELGERDGLPFFAMEFCPKGSLADQLGGTPLPFAEAARLVETLAEAVEAAHEAGIVHRDLKPANVLLAPDGSPKITDFGLARQTDSGSGLTATGAVLGTPSYMAPEQASGSKDIGPGADVYSLGAILYECLVGRPPFRAATAMETVMQVLKEEPVPPSRLVPKLPRDLETICLKCLAKDRRKRYPSAKALAADLRRFLDGRPIAARRAGFAERVWKAAKRRPAAAVGAVLGMFATAAVLLAVAVTLVVVVVSNRRLEEERNEAKNAWMYADNQRRAALDERQRAEARLRKAIEAQDRMLTRIASERWVRDPNLQAERRQMLEDVVAFYEGFGGTDRDDPVVRREKAKALFRIGGLYVALLEHEKAAAALDQATELFARLAEEFPNDPYYKNDLAATKLYRGHMWTSLSGGDPNRVLTLYREGAELARAAAEARPEEDDFRLTWGDCLVASAQYQSGADPEVAGRAYAEAEAVLKPLVERPNPSPVGRLLFAYLIASGAANVDFRAGRVAEGMAKLNRADELTRGMARDQIASPWHRDLLVLTRANVKLYTGLVLGYQPGRQTDAVALLRQARSDFDGLLVANPKLLPARIYKLVGLTFETDLLHRTGMLAEAKKGYAEMLDLADRILADAPRLETINGLVGVARIRYLLLRVRDGEPADLDGEIPRAVRWVPADVKAAVRYDGACAYSLATKFGTTEEREDRARKAVRTLEGLIATGFFGNPAVVRHLDADEDIEPIRDRPDYRAFRARLSPPPVEKAPPPRGK